MQFKLAHSFSPLKMAPMSHGELQQQGAKVPFSSSFGIKEFSHDTSFIHCLYDKDNQLILLLTPKLWCSQMRNFTRQMFSTNVSMLKKANFSPVYGSDPELKNTTATDQEVMLHSEHKQIKRESKWPLLQFLWDGIPFGMFLVPETIFKCLSGESDHPPFHQQDAFGTPVFGSNLTTYLLMET